MSKPVQSIQFLIVASLALASCNAPAQTNVPYLDPTQPPEMRVADLISRMTLSEKAAELYWGGSANARLQIPAWGGWNQCVHGVWTTRSSTLFPVSIALAATWDPDLVHSVADAISDEARAFYQMNVTGPNGPPGLVYRAPVINISRNPFWGRIQECYGEDPWLTSRIGVAYVQGLQGADPKYLKVAATLKHFAVNNVEDKRTTLSASVPERWLYEYWLPHWKACATEGNAQSVMAAYNAINGTHCVINQLLLTDILRTNWGFRGFVTSDTGGINNLTNVNVDHLFTNAASADAAALSAGCDYDDTEYRDGISPAVTSNLVSEAVLDQALGRLLGVAFRLGVFDPPYMVPYTQTPTNVIRSQSNQDLSLQASQESIVLLKNQNNFLPLNKAATSSIALIGPLASNFITGNYYGTPTNQISPLQGFLNRAASNTVITYAQGSSISTSNQTNLNLAVAAAGNAQLVVMCLGTDSSIEAEGKDRTALELPAAQETLLQSVFQANSNMVLVLLNGGPLAIPWAKTNVPAILEAFYNGEKGGDAIADVVFGDVNPGGKLPYTVYPSTSDPLLPPQTQYDVSQGFTYMFYPGQALFPFGHGLSYTTFTYSNLTESIQFATPDTVLSMSVDVQNTGARAGDEVVQVYVRDASSTVVQAIKKLVGFKRIHLSPGQMQTLNFTVSVDQLSYYDDVTTHNFVLNAGNYDLLVGSSSADIRASNSFTLSLPTVVLPNTPIGLAAQAYGTNVELQWNFASRAVNYNVKRAFTNVGPYSIIASALTNASFTDAAPDPVLTNFYIVTASNSAGESLPSSAVSAHVVSLIAPNLNCTINGGNAQLDWPSANTGWFLQAVTNPSSGPPATNWLTVLGSVSTNHVLVPVNPTNRSVFFRLIYP